MKGNKIIFTLLACISMAASDQILGSDYSENNSCKTKHDKYKSKCHKVSGCHYHKYLGVTKYVKGGLCKPGNGSKKCPWNSLALADADTSWNTLVVLASPVELTGGLNMRPGTCLIGEKNPVEGTATGDQCMITNPTANILNGDCIHVVSGDVKIKNIYFREIWNSAIEYNNARNLTVENVLITGYNKGLNTSSVLGRHFDLSFNSFVNSALNAQIRNDGKTLLCNVVIRDNYSGYGLYEEIDGGAKRKIRVENCEFSNLTNSNTNDGSCREKGFANIVSGIFITSYEQSDVDIKIKKTFMHDFDSQPIYSTPLSFPVFIHPHSSTTNLLVENCTFYNLPAPPFDPAFNQCAQSNTAAPFNPLTGFPCCDGCSTQPCGPSLCTSGQYVNPAPPPNSLGFTIFEQGVAILPVNEMQIEPGFLMNGVSIIRNCIFENLPSPFFDRNRIHMGCNIHPMSTSSWTHTVENCIFKNMDISCAALEMGMDVNVVGHYRHNTSNGGFIFFIDSSANWANTDDPSTMVATHNITKNKWMGAPGSLAAITIRPNVWEPRYSHSQWKCAPWQNLTINITDNCFEVPGPTIPGLLPAVIGGFFQGVDGCDVGNGTINAQNNNFIGFITSVNELSLTPNPCKPPRGPLNINYLFATNYWGTSTIPPSLTNPGYTGTLNKGTATLTPFPCPKFDFCP